MALKNYNGRRKEKREAEHEIAGWVLAVFSAILFLCVAFPFIFGPVGAVLCPFMLGLLGFSAYPILLALFVLGVFLIQGRTLAVSKTTIICSAVIAVLLIFILHIATTYSYIGKPIGEYLATTFNAPSTTGMFSAGGVFFGTLVYAIQSILPPIFSIVVYSLGIAVCVFVMLNRRYAFLGNPTPRKTKSQNPSSFDKANRVAAPVKAVVDHSLYVDKIVPVRPYASEGSNFSDLMPPREKTATFTPYSTPSAAAPEPSNELYPANQAKKPDGTYKSKAHEILFGNRDFPALSPEMYPSTPRQVASPPDIRENTPAQKPPKIVHINDYGLTEPPLLPEKDLESRIVSGTIINGDEYSQQIAEQQLPQMIRPPERQTVVPPPVAPVPEDPRRPAIDPRNYDSIFTRYDGFNTEKIQPVKLTNKNDIQPQEESPVSAKDIPASNTLRNIGQDFPYKEEIESISDEPIVNGDFFNAPQLRETPIPSSENPVSPPRDTREDFSFMRDEPVSPPSRDIRAASSGARPVPPELPPRRAGFSDVTPAKPTEPFEDFLDLSETKEAIKNDHTGYYEEVREEPRKTLSFDDRVSDMDDLLNGQIKPAAPKPNEPKPLSAKNQIRLDNYMAESAGSVPAPKARRRRTRYTPPPIELLQSSVITTADDIEADTNERAALLEQTLKGLKLPATVSAITRGPAVTRYELEMPHGIPIRRIEQYVTDIEYYLAANGKIRLETPIPGKRAVGIEVPNAKIDIVTLRDIIQSNEFHKSSSPLTFALGKDIAGAHIICELDKMPHLLIAGATNSGKSACLNSVIMSLIYKSSPEDVRLILIDPKHVEFTIFRDLPHLLTGDIINDGQQALNAFKWLRGEMERRYLLFSKNIVRNLQEYNKCEAVKSGEEEKIPYIVLIVDELAELMMSQNRKDLEEKIMSMAQKARAAGIHLILATQRPSVDVITGTIKANLPSRVAFSLKSVIDSRTILDSAGAETLLGRGDMLYAPIGMDDPKRVQGAYVSAEEVAAVVEFAKEHNEAIFDEEFKESIAAREEAEEIETDSEEDTGFDPLMPNILKQVIETGTASTSFIQRRFSVGYARAARIIDQMELNRFIGPLDGGKARAVFITREKYAELFGEEI